LSWVHNAPGMFVTGGKASLVWEVVWVGLNLYYDQPKISRSLLF
jgi:hypothetical protein